MADKTLDAGSFCAEAKQDLACFRSVGPREEGWWSDSWRACPEAAERPLHCKRRVWNGE